MPPLPLEIILTKLLSWKVDGCCGDQSTVETYTVEPSIIIFFLCETSTLTQ